MRLAVNIDHIATIREARRTDEPDPVTAAAICELAGAQGITVHLRSDRRHIQDRDVELLRKTVTTHLNVEMASTSEMVRIAQTIKPHQVTLVPERKDEITTEGGLDVVCTRAPREDVRQRSRRASTSHLRRSDRATRHCTRSAHEGGDQHCKYAVPGKTEMKRNWRNYPSRTRREKWTHSSRGYRLKYRNIDAIALILRRELDRPFDNLEGRASRLERR